ncbi:MAG: cytidine deaminase [Chloroflexi bacterium]|nr:cytidine deaminase [Chloroflexota bacterium]
MAGRQFERFSREIEAREDELARRAIAAAARSYSPYSGFPVGACLVWLDPQSGGIGISVGCNVENAFYESGHAEQAAIMAGVSAGYRRLVAAYVACTKPEPGSPLPLAIPCGFCRQWMCEFVPEGEDAAIAIVAKDGSIRARFRLIADLLPRPFRLG